MEKSGAQLTLADIARVAGVSLTTASRAVNNRPGVSAKTRDHVMRVAEEHSFVVSPEAVRLARGGSQRVAVVVPHLSRWFFGEMVEGIVAVLRAAEVDVMLYHVGTLRDRQEFFEQLPARRKVDAVIVVGFPVEEAEQERLRLLDVNIVAAGGQHAVYPNVCIDDEAAGRQAMDHLLFLGHTRIGTIEAVDPDQPREPSGRSHAYRAALSDAGIAFDPALVVTTPWGGEAGSVAMSALLSLKEPPTAVYAHSDEVAIGAMRSIRRAGLRVPQDISVIAIDDHPMAALLDLTTVHQGVREQGTLAADMALELLNGVTPDSLEITVPTQLMIRGSTAPPRAGRTADSR